MTSLGNGQCILSLIKLSLLKKNMLGLDGKQEQD